MSGSNAGNSKFNCCFCSQVFKKEWEMISHSTWEHGYTHQVISIMDSISIQNENFSFGLSGDMTKDIKNIKTDLVNSIKEYEIQQHLKK